MAKFFPNHLVRTRSCLSDARMLYSLIVRVTVFPNSGPRSAAALCYLLFFLPCELCGVFKFRPPSRLNPTRRTPPETVFFVATSSFLGSPPRAPVTRLPALPLLPCCELAAGRPSPSSTHSRLLTTSLDCKLQNLLPFFDLLESLSMPGRFLFPL